MLGTLLDGRYRLIRVLGSGGFGQTCLAEDTLQPDEPKCVVKQFKPATQDEEFLEIARRLFFNEVEMLRKLGSHDRIPALLNNFEEDDQFYLVQEYIDGRALSDELSVLHRLDEPQVIALLRDVLEILEFVHQNYVIHRDIKPNNLIRRQQDGKLVLIDFGAVKEIQTQLLQDAGQTKLTVGIATQGYGPSEQLAGKPRYNSDLYALGMTAIQALTGAHPSQLPTHLVTGDVIWRDRCADITPWLAGILDKMVRYHFNQRYQSATDVLQALDQTTILPPTDVQSSDQWLDDTLLPETQFDQSHVPLVLPEPLRPFFRRWLAPLSVGVASAIATGFVVGARHLSWLQSPEIAAFDRMTQLSPDPGPDPRILVVGITEADLKEQKRFPLSDQVVAQLLKRLQQSKPRAIGLDLYRDIPQQPGHQALLTELKAANVIAITNLEDPITPPPPGVPAHRVGFNDVPLDLDSAVRRILMFADVTVKQAGQETQETFFSFALRLAMLYLSAENITLKPSPRNSNITQLNRADLIPLESDSGGYQTIDNQGYQILLKYRGRAIAQQVSLGQVLKGRVKPEQIKDKVVLIGTTAPSGKDLFLTPYSPVEQAAPRMPGVLIHAQILSQFLSTGLNDQRPFWFWTEWLEIAWIGGWAVLSGSLAWHILRRPLVIILGETVLFIGCLAIGFAIFLQQGWIPIVAPALAILATGGIVIVYQIIRYVKTIVRDRQ